MISLHEKTQFFREKWLPSQIGEVILERKYSKFTPVTYCFRAAGGTGVPFDAQGGPFWDEAALNELVCLYRNHNSRVRAQTPPRRGPCQLHDRETAHDEAAEKLSDRGIMSAGALAIAHRVVAELESEQQAHRELKAKMDDDARTVTGRTPSQPNEQWLPPNRVAVSPRTATDAELVAASSSGLKDTNPKDAIGALKVPLDKLSPVAKAHWACAQDVGSIKYGAWNWRAAGVRASIYIAAMQRHIDHWQSGEQCDPKEKVHHLGAVMACAGILLDAQAAGKLVDDRPPSVPLGRVYADVEAAMALNREQYAGKSPKHYTIQDTWTAGQPAAQVKPAR